MLRSMFFSTGLFVLLWGIAFLFIDRVTLNITEQPHDHPAIRAMFTSVEPGGKQLFDPPQWAAFSLMSIGSVTVLYAVALPKKK
ncbi:MAG: hypothetical protein KDA79_04070 [Planctomycetaceae bacterium]|nr:hypothetical protein [Planctomycetaceae bacterium]